MIEKQLEPAEGWVKYVERLRKLPLQALDFVERLARMELEAQQALIGKPRLLWHCPCCDGPVVCFDKMPARFVHEGDCPVVEARRLLGLPTDERGNLVEEE